MEDNKNVQNVEETKTTEAQAEQEGTQESEPITIDSLMAELAKTKAESAKNKAALDKALHNNGELTKQLRAKMTASEQEAEAKREAEEAQANRIKELENYKKRSEARERYMATIGMSADLAKEAADAEVNGDMDALASVYKRHQESVMKANEAEWMKKLPKPEAGKADSGAVDPFLAGFNSAI